MSRPDYSPQPLPVIFAVYNAALAWNGAARTPPSPAARGASGAKPAGPRSAPTTGPPEVQRRSVRAAAIAAAFAAAGALSCGASAPSPPAEAQWSAELRVAVSAAAAGLPPSQAGAADPGVINRMVLESSPYLRAHARQPIDWRPYGSEALREAQTTGRPIFLSVGYTTCHWCHVMSAEAYVDPEIAALLNAHTIPILVDRQERPEVDRLAMALLVGMTGRGGWPLHLLLSPDGAPLWGASYLPARPDPTRPNTPSLLEVLTEFSVSHADPARVAAGARLLRATEAALSPPASPAAPDLSTARPTALSAALRAASAPRRPGPRFPLSRAPGQLLRAAEASDGRADLALRAELSGWLDGALLDPVEGGFFRYTTDPEWQRPHYEKMLLDNVLMAELLLGALSLDPPVEGGPGAARALQMTLDWLLDHLRTPTGCFGAGLDADSPSPAGPVEGLRYTFTPASLGAALALNDVPEGILARQTGAADAPRPLLGALLRRPEAEAWRAALLAERRGRAQPPLDPAELLGANALAVQVLAQSAGALDEPRYLEAAARCAAQLQAASDTGDARARQRVGDRAGGEATLFDRAALQQAALALAAESGAPEALRWAQRESEATHRQLGLAEGGWSEPTARWSDGDPAPQRRLADAADGAEPVGLARMISAERALSAWTGDPAPRRRAERATEAIGGRVEAQPGRHTAALEAADRLEDDLLTVVVVEGTADAPGAAALWSARARSPARDAPALRIRPGADRAALPPWAADKGPAGPQSVAIVCLADRCLAPTADPEALRRSLQALRRAPDRWLVPAP